MNENEEGDVESVVGGRVAYSNPSRKTVQSYKKPLAIVGALGLNAEAEKLSAVPSGLVPPIGPPAMLGSGATPMPMICCDVVAIALPFASSRLSVMVYDPISGGV